MYQLKITATAKKELKDISYQHKQALLQVILDLKDDPYIGKPLTRELTGRFSYKVSVYRIIYTVNEKDKIVKILTAGHRSKIYQ